LQYAQLISEKHRLSIRKRVAFRRAIKERLSSKKSRNKRYKIKISGRLGGAEIARSEKYKFGKIPLQTLRANIDYGFSEALTT